MSSSVITSTCHCGKQGRTRHYTDPKPPYPSPQGWTRDHNGHPVCDECSQAKRDATGFQQGDPVSWETPFGTTLYGRVRAVAIQRYGQVKIVVQPDDGTWRQQQNLNPEQVVSL
jgi:hypothetical protein